MPSSKNPKKAPKTRADAAYTKAPAAKRPGGGTATGGGINFQASVTAIAGVHLLRGTSPSWLPVAEVPVAIWAESEEAGDDIRLELPSGLSVEIQVKKGLNRSPKLWEALEELIKAARDGHIAYGILAIAPDSSRTIREDLAKDLQRLGRGRKDRLSDIGNELHRRLQGIGGTWKDACQRVCIRVVHALKLDDANIETAKELLKRVCAEEAKADAAWNALYRDAVALIEHRGRWTMNHLVALLEREGIEVRDDDFPAGTSTKLAKWVLSTRNSFALPAVRRALPLSSLLEMRVVATEIEPTAAEDAAAALANYHDAAGAPSRDIPVYDAEWLGRFRRRAVVVAGPGLGKSTLLTQLANSYATDGFPVLHVQLKLVAAAMKSGNSFDRALRNQALDGSGITLERFDRAQLDDLVVLTDGLDDCGSEHETVAQALRAFAIGHPSARVVVTTRPIGYSSAALSDWKHYRLLKPNKDHGVVNLAKLLGALPGIGDAFESYRVAVRELPKSQAAEAISSSPQLLGMAASLIRCKGNLPSTKPQLYSKLIDLFETAAGAAASCPIPAPVFSHVLNSLGWLLMCDPLLPASLLIERCAELLAGRLGCSTFAMLEKLENTFRYLESLGVIEQLHHDGTAYWTFVHKTFTEFTAARFLKVLPKEQCAAELDRLFDQPDWHEVIVFSAAFGLGDEIARRFVEKWASLDSSQMEHALALAGDKDVRMASDLVQRLTKLSFEAIEAQGGKRFSVGLALAKLAEVQQTMVSPIASTYLQDKRIAVQLTAWACVVSVEPSTCGADELTQALGRLLPFISKPFSVSLLGSFQLNTNKDRDLVERIALAALTAQLHVDLKAFIETYLCHEALDNMNFRAKVESLLREKGVTAEAAQLPWRDSEVSSVSRSDEWSRAYCRALRALSEAVVTEGETAGIDTLDPRRLPHLSALVELVGFRKVPGSDFYWWNKPYDAVAMRTILNALVRASQIDPQALGIEASAVMSWSEDELKDLFLGLPRVDVPEPNWRKAEALVLDRATLETVMNHGSISMAWVAGNILTVSSPNQEWSRSMLDSARGSALWAATEVVREQHSVDIANSLIIDRLKGAFFRGTEYLFKGLEEGKVESTPAVGGIIRRGLASLSPVIAEAAANLAKSLVERGQPLEPKMIVEFYDDWMVREPKQKDGAAVPPSPRETLLKLMISLEVLDDARLLASLSDARSEVRGLGKKHLLAQIATSQVLKDEVVERILSRSLPAATAASVIQDETPLSDEQIRALEELTYEEDPRWRRVGVELLRPCYLSRDEIKKHAARLSEDEKEEIRRAVLQRVGRDKTWREA